MAVTMESEEGSIVRNVVISVIFFTFTPLVIAISVFCLLFIKSTPRTLTTIASSSTVPPLVYASLPKSFPVVSSSIEITDARPEIIKQYLERYNSPIANLANDIVTIADKYSINPKLLVAIAQQESNLCKKIPPTTFNCWGWGIHSAGTLGFSSFTEGIEVVSRGLKENYINKGYRTVDEIMDKWVPHSPERAWARGVSSFLEEMQ